MLAPESLVLRRTTTRRHQPSTCFLAPTSSINLGFLLRENLPLYASHLPLGVPNGRVLYAYQDCFLAPLPGDQDTLQGESPHPNLFTLFLSCFILFTTLFAALNQNTKKLVASFTLFTILFAFSIKNTKKLVTWIYFI